MNLATHFVLTLFVGVVLVSGQLSFAGGKNPNAAKPNGTIDTRLGLLASSLGKFYCNLFNFENAIGSQGNCEI